MGCVRRTVQRTGSFDAGNRVSSERYYKSITKFRLNEISDNEIPGISAGMLRVSGNEIHLRRPMKN